jgi:Tfp pilus assembly ATPase PilU
MADSELKLKNTRLAIRNLAKGDIANLINYITREKNDGVVEWDKELITLANKIKNVKLSIL